MTVSEKLANHRGMVRNLAATLAFLTSISYFHIGFRLVTVLDNVADQTAFGLIAGSAFLIGALAILLFDNRILMGLGALAQVFIILMYFNLAPEREPSYEVWGITIRVLQVLLLGALAYLAIRPKEAAQPPAGQPAREDVTVG
jgi:hypothetical protein